MIDERNRQNRQRGGFLRPGIFHAMTARATSARRMAAIGVGLAAISIVVCGALETAGAEGQGTAPATTAAGREARTVAVKVVDEEGLPVADAEVALVGLRTAGDPGSYYGLGDEFKDKPGLKTNARGEVDLRYPKFVVKEMATGTVVVTVSHPEFCVSQVELAPGRPTPIVLKRGRRIVLKAHLAGNNEPLDRLCADVGLTFIQGSPWKKVEGGISARLPDTIRSIRAIAFDENNVPLFSRPVEIGRGEGSGGSLNLEVRKGTELKGRLSANVPRPVVNGRVVAEVATPSPDEEKPRFLWNTGGAIDASGDFTVKNLPEGTVRLVALCDGFVSQNPAGENQTFPVWAAQSFSEDRSKVVEIAMERSGTAKITVLTPEGKPAAKATVSFWPNQSFDSGTSLFGRIIELGDYLRAQQWGGPAAVAKLQTPYTRFSAVTDAGGVATIKELPGNPQNFRVEAAGMEMPISKDRNRVPRRWGHIGIKSGEISAQTIQMEPEGATSLKDAMEAYRAAQAKAKEEEEAIEPAPSLREPQLFQIRAVAEKPSATTEPFTQDHHGEVETLALEKTVLLDLSAVKSFAVERNGNGTTTVRFTLTGAGREKFTEITARYLQHRIAFLAEGKLLVAPYINEKISGGVGSLGNVSEPEAAGLVKRLNAAIADRLPVISGTAAK